MKNYDELEKKIMRNTAVSAKKLFLLMKAHDEFFARKRKTNLREKMKC